MEPIRRNAVVLVYALRLHLVTMLVFRAEGLTWPGANAGKVGPVAAAWCRRAASTSRSGAEVSCGMRSCPT